MQVTQKRFGHALVAVNTDKVLVGWAVPSECVVTGITGEVHVIGNTDTGFLEATSYGMLGVAAPYGIVGGLSTVDGITYSTLFDQLVPKMSATMTIDLTAGAANAEPAYEPGMIVEGSPFDIQVARVTTIFERRRWLSLAKGAMMQNWVTASASTYVPVDVVPIRVRRRIYFPEHGAVMFAGIAPNMDELSAAVSARGPFPIGVAGSADIELYHHTLKFLGDVLQQALYAALGLVAEAASGASLAADDLLIMLEDILVHATVVETANAFRAKAFNFYSEFTLQMTVPGSAVATNIGPEGRG